ncbi:hypothetical protein ACH4SP_03980 [Streptomyces sp. NPDC021093]|uniref:hypothetical protein n=1 Tax=Streptomyces sp. NPDC021093 TaxID=3365112 RepID=UPI0037A10BAA
MRRKSKGEGRRSLRSACGCMPGGWATGQAAAGVALALACALAAPAAAVPGTSAEVLASGEVIAAEVAGGSGAATGTAKEPAVTRPAVVAATIGRVEGPTVTLRAKEERTLPRVLCPQGQASTGGGLRINPNNGVFIREATPGGSGYDVVVDNQSDEPRTVTPLVICTTDPTLTHQIGPAASGDEAISDAVCPAGQVAAGGGAIAAPRNYLSRSFSGGSYWSARAKNQGSIHSGVNAFARCSSRPHSRASHSITLPAGGVGTAHAECPSGQVPTAGGGLGHSNVLHNASSPTATGWDLRATNADSAPRTLIVEVVCTAP